MTLKDSGVSETMSKYVFSDRIIKDRPINQYHIVIYRLPGDDQSVFKEPGEAMMSFSVSQRTTKDIGRSAKHWASSPQQSRPLNALSNSP